MIQVIYGEKGTGKTKQIVDLANAEAKTAKGIIVYLDRTNNRIHDLDREIRLVDASHYGLSRQKDILSFIKGMLAANFDIEKIFIDGLTRLLDCNVAELEEIYTGIDAIAKEFNVSFVITASSSKENLPKFVAKYVK
ncbi:MAG: hypothetical protein NC183_05330 [Corallococcus sp.]|nr:hypothetical protein [Corallococcus sp.]MCM1359929.1 hypothetical protein [Corallococcus sp.]